MLLRLSCTWWVTNCVCLKIKSRQATHLSGVLICILFLYFHVDFGLSCGPLLGTAAALQGASSLSEQESLAEWTAEESGYGHSCHSPDTAEESGWVRSSRINVTVVTPSPGFKFRYIKISIFAAARF